VNFNLPTALLNQALVSNFDDINSINEFYWVISNKPCRNPK